jgi:hypothetical protein
MGARQAHVEGAARGRKKGYCPVLSANRICVLIQNTLQLWHQWRQVVGYRPPHGVTSTASWRTSVLIDSPSASGVTRSTLHSSISSRASLSRTNSNNPTGLENSTRRSTSLSGLASSRAEEPNRARDLTPSCSKVTRLSRSRTDTVSPLTAHLHGVSIYVFQFSANQITDSLQSWFEPPLRKPDSSPLATALRADSTA